MSGHKIIAASELHQLGNLGVKDISKVLKAVLLSSQTLCVLDRIIQTAPTSTKIYYYRKRKHTISQISTTRGTEAATFCLTYFDALKTGVIES